MQRPFEPVPGPIDAGAASRNRGARAAALCLLPLALLTACGAGSAPPTGNETVIAADDGTYERLPLNAPVRIDGTVSARLRQGAVIDMGNGLCAHLAMSDVDWDALMPIVRVGARVTVVGHKAAGPHPSACRIHLERVGFLFQ